MNVVVDKFKRLEREIATERGEFILFALFAPDKALADRWDLVVSAPWLRDRNEGVDLLVHEIKSRLGAEQLIALSRIVVVPPDAPPVHELTRDYPVEHGNLEVRDATFFGVPVKHAFFITAQTPTPAAAA